MVLGIFKRCYQGVLPVLMAGLLSVSLLSTASCAAGESTAENSRAGSPAEDGLTIVSSVFAAFDFSRSLAGEAEVSLLIPPGVEPHSFEPSPADIKLLTTADVFICAGGESDVWLDKIIDSLDNPDLKVLRLTDMVTTLDDVALEGMDMSGHVHEGTDEDHANESTDSDHAEESSSDAHDHEDESTQTSSASGTAHAESDDEHAVDEHVWTSLRNAQSIVTALCETFSELDPERANQYRSNAQSLKSELAALDDRITTIVQTAKRNTIVFGDRFPFRYFARDYGLDCYAAFPGCSTAVDTSPATLTFLIDRVNEEDLPVVFYIELSDQRIATTLSEATGAQTLCLQSAHVVSQEDFDANITYLSIMEANADNLERALN